MAELQCNILLAYIYFWHAVNPGYSRNISVQKHLSCTEMHVMEKKEEARAFPTLLFSAMLIPRMLSRIPSAVI